MLTYRSGWFLLLIFHFSLCMNSAQRFMPRFEHYSLEDGISDLRISAFVQDHQGFLWFGTEDGLNRYDGYESKVYRHNPTSLAPGIVLSLMADSSAEEQFLKCTLELVETHLEDADFSTEDFPKSMQLSRTQLHRKLKTITGMSATDFVRNIRLEQAALLLGKTAIRSRKLLTGWASRIFRILVKRF